MNIFVNINWNQFKMSQKLDREYIPADLRHIKGDLTLIIGDESIIYKSTIIVVDLVGIINTIILCSKNTKSIYDMHISNFAELSLKSEIIKDTNFIVFISKINGEVIHSQPMSELLALCESIEKWLYESMTENCPQLTILLRDCVIMR